MMLWGPESGWHHGLACQICSLTTFGLCFPGKHHTLWWARLPEAVLRRLLFLLSGTLAIHWPFVVQPHPGPFVGLIELFCAMVLAGFNGLNHNDDWECHLYVYGMKLISSHINFLYSAYIKRKCRQSMFKWSMNMRTELEIKNCKSPLHIISICGPLKLNCEH